MPFDAETRGVSAERARATASVRVLIAARSRSLAQRMRLSLSHASLDVRTVGDIAAAKALLEEWQPHLMVVDLMLGQGRLLEELSRRRGTLERAASIAIVSRGDLESKLRAYEKGALDVMVAPFAPDEMLAKSLALMRYREGIRRSFRTTLRVGELELDILLRRVRVGGYEVHLTPLEEALLYLLAANPGQVLTRDEILDAVWGANYDGGSNVVDQHVRGLRTKLQNSHRDPRYISTVPGRGYLFVPYEVAS